ncbi:hypothetical protein [Miltoncostaea marina]|uniref:hypothetical protein n=1 Tax=Miltoncostaea marina TaxID=2843215 RepID=UPI001C3DCB44|nr:hypothetical protein [Miltoncostaea marina]
MRCETAGVTVHHEQPATAEAMDRSYDGHLASEEIQRGEGTTCERGAPAEGTWNGSRSRVARWTNDVGAWAVWRHAA